MIVLEMRGMREDIYRVQIKVAIGIKGGQETGITIKLILEIGGVQRITCVEI